MKVLHIKSLDTLVESRECHSIDDVVSEINFFFLYTYLQCVCDWDDRDKKFIEIEAVVRQQIKVLILSNLYIRKV